MVIVMTIYCLDIIIDTDKDFSIENYQHLGYNKDDDFYFQNYRTNNIDRAAELLIDTIKNIHFNEDRLYIASNIYGFLSTAIGNLYDLQFSGPFNDQNVCNAQRNYEGSQILITRVESEGGLEELLESLEKIDPKDQYIGTELEGLDAFERQLKRFTLTDNELKYRIPKQ